MSFYGYLFGQNPDTNKLKSVLELNKYPLGNFLDIYLNEDKSKIYVITKNGGVNRQHEPIEEGFIPGTNIILLNSESDKCPCVGCVMKYKVSLHPNYLKDYDDDFDESYAYIEYFIPEKQKNIVNKLKGGKIPTIREKFTSID